MSENCPSCVGVAYLVSVPSLFGRIHQVCPFLTQCAQGLSSEHMRLLIAHVVHLVLLGAFLSFVEIHFFPFRTQVPHGSFPSHAVFKVRHDAHLFFRVTPRGFGGPAGLLMQGISRCLQCQQGSSKGGVPSHIRLACRQAAHFSSFGRLDPLGGLSLSPS